MARDPDTEQVAAALQLSIGLLRRQLRQAKLGGELTLPESSALARLDRGGPTSSAALARLEEISPQSMGATLAGLEQRGLIARHRDPEDGRRALISLTEAGLQALRNRRNEGTARLAQAIATEFTAVEMKRLSELAPLLERLAQRI